MGGGVEAKILLLRVSPGFRFTRWGEATAGPAGSAQFGLAGSNQADFLVGITF